MGRLFEYFAEHASYDSFAMGEFLDLQGCLTKYVATKEFKKLVEGIKSSKSTTSQYKNAKRFADRVASDNYQILEQAPFINYWTHKEEIMTRTKLEAAQRYQAARQIQVYSNMLVAMSNCASNKSSDNEASEYSARESTPSTSSSPSEDDTSDTYQYLMHNGDSYEYKLKSNSSRWIVSGHDVSSSFINFRNAAIKKAEDLNKLNDCEQLALHGIMLIENDFINTDIVSYDIAQAILKEIDEIDYCQPVKLEKSHQDLITKFAVDMAVRHIDKVKIQNYLKKFRHDQDTYQDTVLCDIITDLANTYSSDYSTDDANEATLVRDTIEIFCKAYFPNTTLTKSLGADKMMQDSSKRFIESDPSLTTCGKRAHFSVVSNKSQHVLLSLEAKSNKTKSTNDLVKLFREFKDTMVAIGEEGRSGVVLCGILMKGNCCQVYSFDHRYDGLYRGILLKMIHMPRNCYDMHQVQSIIPLFQKLAMIVESSALILRNPPPADARIPESIAAMHTPTIVRVSKRKLEKKSPGVRHARRKLFK